MKSISLLLISLLVETIHVSAGAESSGSNCPGSCPANSQRIDEETLRRIIEEYIEPEVARRLPAEVEAEVARRLPSEVEAEVARRLPAEVEAEVARRLETTPGNMFMLRVM